MADRSMKIYMNHPQTICIHPLKWRVKIPSRLGGVRRQRIPPPQLPQTTPSPENSLWQIDL